MLRLVFGVLASRRRQASSLALLAVLAVAAGTAAPLYAAAADRHVVSAEVAAATPIERSVAVTAEVSSSAGPADALAQLARQVRGAVPQLELTEITGGLVRGRALATGQSEPLATSLVVRDDVCSHLALSGTCPREANEVAVSAPTAQHLGLRTGARFAYRLDGQDQPLTLRVVGIYDPDEQNGGGRHPTGVDAPYWAGRAELTPQPLRTANPIFTPMATLSAAGHATFVGTVDLIAGENALTPKNLHRLGPALVDARYEPGLKVVSGLPQLVERIEKTRRVLSVSAPLGALQLLILSWLVLLLAAGYGAAQRSSEAALNALRGVPTRYRVVLALGPTALVLAAAAPFGFGVGWLLVRAMTWMAFAEAGAVPVTWTALAVAGATLLGVLAGAAIAERRSQAGPLVDALRQVPPRRRLHAASLVELSVVVLALAAVGQSLMHRQVPGGGLPLLVPVLLALVAGILAARLVRSAAAAIGERNLQRGRVAFGLAAVQVARSRGADRLVTLSVVALTLLGFATSAWDAVGRVMHERAAVELGAARVLVVHAVSRPALLSAVRAADPDGRWAMAVARQQINDTRLVALDSTRLAAVADWPTAAGAPTATQVAAALRPSANPPVRLTGAALVLDFTVREPLGTPLPVTVALTGPHGEPVTGKVDVGSRPGPHRYQVDVPICARPPGCRLGWLSFAASPHRLALDRIGQIAPRRTILEGRALESAARWRPSIGAEGEVSIHSGDGHVTLSYSPPRDAQVVSTDIRLQVADAPLPLPVVAAGPARLVDTQELRTAPVLSALPRRVEVAQALPLLPGVGSDGILADLEYADRLSDHWDNNAELQVWLAPHAPADAVQRLRAAGLVPLRDEAVVDRAARYRMQGTGLGLLLHLVASVLAVLLAALALLVLAAVDSPRKAVDLDALRAQGVDRRTVARAIRGGYLGVVGVAIPFGVLASGLAWAAGRAAVTPVDIPGALALPGPRLAVVLPSLAGGALVLVGAALLAARRLTRTIGAQPPDVPEAHR